jgi:hypothetical protein
VLVHSSVKQLGSSRQHTTAAGSVRASKRQHSEGVKYVQNIHITAHHWVEPYANLTVYDGIAASASEKCVTVCFCGASDYHKWLLRTPFIVS